MKPGTKMNICFHTLFIEVAKMFNKKVFQNVGSNSGSVLIVKLVEKKSSDFFR